jgi:hypothetical protein
MRSLRTFTAGAFVFAAAIAVAAAPASAGPSITFDRSDVAVAVGDRFTLTSMAAGADVSTPQIAHLNVVSLSPEVYVDPEDWSGQRSQPMAATLTWNLQAVNAGRFDVYVVIVPVTGTGPLAVSSPVHVTVTARRAISAGGALPVAITVPLLVAGALLLNRRRYRTS